MNFNNKDYVLHIGDCIEYMKKIESESIDLIVTSPPYNIGKKYGVYNDNRNFEEWKKLIDDFLKESNRILKDSGSIFLNLSPIPIGKDREIFPLPYLGYELIKKNNFFVKNIITWTFNNMQNCTNRLSGRYENIIWAIKDKTKFKFNLDEVRVEYITKNDKRLTGLGRNPTDVWFFNRVNNVTKKKKGISHPTVYPEEMIERIIKMTTNINDIVLDPFLGSGTTIIAALELNRKAIGIELDKKYEKEIIKRINEIKQKLL
jgi:DNA modification methylase